MPATQIDTPQGVRAITDYNGYNGFGRGIAYVLRGWPSKPGETEARHDVTLKDGKVWNNPTNARDWGSNAARINGNSIFIFAIADLCIGHLGHLHHRLTKEHLMQALDADFIWPDRPTIEVVREELPEKLSVVVLAGDGGN